MEDISKTLYWRREAFCESKTLTYLTVFICIYCCVQQMCYPTFKMGNVKCRTCICALVGVLIKWLYEMHGETIKMSLVPFIPGLFNPTVSNSNLTGRSRYNGMGRIEISITDWIWNTGTLFYLTTRITLNSDRFTCEQAEHRSPLFHFARRRGPRVLVQSKKQSLYRLGVAQRVPGS